MTSSSEPKLEPANSRSKVWAYFKQCDGNPDKVKCLLCSTKLCNKGTTSLLWNHIFVKHYIDKSTVLGANAQKFTNGHSNATVAFDTAMLVAEERLHDRDIFHKTSQSKHLTPVKIDSSSKSMNESSMTKNAQQKLNKSSATLQHTKSNSNNKASSTSLRRNLELIDYEDFSLASMKPSPSTSLSRTLISRLNQLSSPLARKLKFWNKKSFQVNQYDPSFKVIYLGNLGVQFWSKDENCLDKPLNTLWNNYLVNMRTEIVMRLTICNSGLKAITRQHGLTQYWSNRLVYCCSHKNYPKIFSWIYRHEGKKMRQELRCHAVFCSSPERASKMVTLLNQRLACALQEFKREKKSRCSSLITENSTSLQKRIPRTIPLRRQILAKGAANFRPPLERSKSAPKLTSILEEEHEPEDDENDDEDVSQDEFEYQQSFGDKDDYDDESDYDDVESGKTGDQADETSAQGKESNSLSTTANEETSNSGSVSNIGDSRNDIKPNVTTSLSLRINDSSSPVELHRVDCESSARGEYSLNIRSNDTQDYLDADAEQQPAESCSSSNQTSAYDDSSCHNQFKNQNGSNQQSSANITQYIHSCSSVKKKKHIQDNQDRNNLDSTIIHIDKNDVKNNNSTRNAKDLQIGTLVQTTTAADAAAVNESATQEIILSWSNLVIK